MGILWWRKSRRTKVRVSQGEVEEAMRQVREILASRQETREKAGTTKAGRRLTEVCLELFEYEHCSWCKKFYTRPSGCPYDRQLEEKCLLFEKIDDNARRVFLGDKYWQTIIVEIMSVKLNPSSATKCRHCGATNVDPSITHGWTCWRCGGRLA